MQPADDSNVQLLETHVPELADAVVARRFQWDNAIRMCKYAFASCVGALAAGAPPCLCVLRTIVYLFVYFLDSFTFFSRSACFKNLLIIYRAWCLQ